MLIIPPQVLAYTLNKMTPISERQVFRAHFSSIAAPDIRKAVVRAHAARSCSVWRAVCVVLERVSDMQHAQVLEVAVYRACTRASC